jgi:hypothetical protein
MKKCAIAKICAVCGKPVAIDVRQEDFSDLFTLGSIHFLERAYGINSCLKGEEFIIVSFVSLVFGIHESQYIGWMERGINSFQDEMYFCARHGCERLLASEISQIVAAPVLGVDNPQCQEGLGHWITAKILRRGRLKVLYNIQLARESFLEAIKSACALPGFGKNPWLSQIARS